MKWICRLLKCMQIFLFTVASLILIDMLLLGGSIKLWIVAVANTTSASPFSSDGQMNWILILLIGIIIGIMWIIANKLKEKKKDA